MYSSIWTVSGQRIRMGSGDYRQFPESGNYMAIFIYIYIIIHLIYVLPLPILSNLSLCYILTSHVRQAQARAWRWGPWISLDFRLSDARHQAWHQVNMKRLQLLSFGQVAEFLVGHEFDEVMHIIVPFRMQPPVQCFGLGFMWRFQVHCLCFA